MSSIQNFNRKLSSLFLWARYSAGVNANAIAAVFFDVRLGLSSWWCCVWEYFYPLEIFSPSPPRSPQGFFFSLQAYSTDWNIWEKYFLPFLHCSKMVKSVWLKLKPFGLNLSLENFTSQRNPWRKLWAISEKEGVGLEKKAGAKTNWKSPLTWAAVTPMYFSVQIPLWLSQVMVVAGRNQFQ